MRMPKTKCPRREPSWETRSPAVTAGFGVKGLKDFTLQVRVSWGVGGVSGLPCLKSIPSLATL